MEDRNSTRLIRAPLSTAQTGYLVDLTSMEESEPILQKIESSGGRVRSINPNHGLYEVFDLDLNKLSKIVPESSITKNIFWQKKRTTQRPSDDPMNYYCPNSAWAPKMILRTTPDQILIPPEEPTLLKRDGRNITFSVTFDRTDVEYRWETSGPPASKYSNAFIENTSLQFLPDELGEYSVHLIVKSGENQCWRMFLIGVTDDKEFSQLGAAVELSTEEKLIKFTHLNTLGVDKAWPVSLGQGAQIAILDSGVDYNHPDITMNMSLNFTDKPGDNVDGDRNNFVDDYIGWDFVNNDKYPYDDSMHGTHVAGLAGSLVGVAPRAKILAVKVLGPYGGDLGSLAGGIYYAVDRGAKILNLSLGSSKNSPVINKAIAFAQTRNVLIVVASGNDGENIDLKPTYPASLKYENLLVVAATDLQGNLTDYSNVGSISVDVATPGGSEKDGGLLSTFYTNRLNRKYIKAQGTSMATPIVSGVAALLLAQYPKMGARELIAKLLQTSATQNSYRGILRTTSWINAEKLFEVPVPTP